MKFIKKLSAAAVVIALVMGLSAVSDARVMFSGYVNDFGMDMLATANFTVDEWFNNSNLWTITISNTVETADPSKEGSDSSGLYLGRTIKYAVIKLDIVSGSHGSLVSGDMTVVNAANPLESFLTELRPGESYTINNTMLDQSAPQMSNGEWSTEFKDEVLRIGYLPEGTYTMNFTLTGFYEDASDPIDSEVDMVSKTIDVKNPNPPELITPYDMSDDTVAVPRFMWQRPIVSDYSAIGKTIDVYYNITLWKMFDEAGTILSQEDAITRIPIWKEIDLNQESIDFDPNQSREEIISGRTYCWQIQALDGTGRPVSIKNQGKSEVWQFTVQFSPPVINEPLSFSPLGFTWTPARAGGGNVQYKVRIADNLDFIGAYELTGQVMTSFTYPQDAPALQQTTLYYVELQTTDDSNVPIGEPATVTFTLPARTVTLDSPLNDVVVSSTTPRFSWRGTRGFFVVTISDEGSDWTYTSSAIQAMQWTYDGDELMPGATYSWNVSPANNLGDVVGRSSSTRRFRLPVAGQIMVTSPVGEMIDSLVPTFSWREFSSPAIEGTIEYNIIIESRDGSVIHNATVTTTTYDYPTDATPLEYATKYNWSVNAQVDNIEVGGRSASTSFTTPIVEEGTQTATVTEISKIIQLVLTDFPEYETYAEMVVTSISDETGQLSTEAFLELFDTFKIVKVSER